MSSYSLAREPGRLTDSDLERIRVMHLYLLDPGFVLGVIEGQLGRVEANVADGMSFEEAWAKARTDA